MSTPSLVWKPAPGYRPLNQALFEAKERSLMKTHPIRVRMQIKKHDIASILDWLAVREIKFEWQSWDRHLYFYLSQNKHAMMFKLTWAA
jgi:hypothetical protein